MFTSFSTALSALNAHSTAIDVVGNNLANLNTAGFKANTVAFHDLVSQSIGAELGATQIGFGVGRPVTLREFSQGAIQASSGLFDAAIQGDGFFIVQNAAGAVQYTRAGNFQVDQNGTLITATGEHLQGWTQQNGVIDTNAPVSAITIPVGTPRPAVATQNFSFDINLNGGATAGPPPDTFSASVEVYDSLGVSHVVTAKFTRNAKAGQWDYSLTFPSSDTTSPFTPVTGSLTFDGTGKLTSPTPSDPPPQMQIKGLTSGASDLTLNWQLFNRSTPRLTQFTLPSAVSAVSQDGSAATQLTRVSISDSGKILAQYLNGEQNVVGQIAVATIRNPDSLIAVGDNDYQRTALTALPAIGAPGTGGRGQVLGGAIESSTVDIAREFTNLIVLQRGYQANARVITTVDELSQDTINLKHA